MKKAITRVREIFIKKPPLHVCRFETYMITGEFGHPARAYVQRCTCGKEQVVSSTGVTTPINQQL